MNFRTDYNLIPPDVVLCWDGWQAEAGRLAQCGWDIEVIREPHRLDGIRLLLRNRELKLQGYSDGISVVRWHQWFEDRGAPRSSVDGSFFHADMVVDLKIAGAINIHTHSSPHHFRGLQAEPAEFAMNIGKEIVPLSYLYSRQKKPDEIVIEKRPEVIDLLNQIKDIQNPRAKELLAQERKKGKVESFEASTNIIALRA